MTYIEGLIEKAKERANAWKIIGSEEDHKLYSALAEALEEKEKKYDMALDDAALSIEKEMKLNKALELSCHLIRDVIVCRNCPRRSSCENCKVEGWKDYFLNEANITEDK